MLAALSTNLESHFARQATDHLAALEAKSRDNASAAADELHIGIKQAKEARKALYIRVLGTGALVGALAIVVRYMFFWPVDSTVGAQLLLSGALEVAFTAGAYLLGKWRDKFPQRVRNIQRKHDETIHTQWREAIHAAAREPLVTSAYEQMLAKDVGRIYRQLFASGPESHWNGLYSPTLEQLVACHTRLDGLLQRHSAIMDELQTAVVGYLKDSEANIAKLADISARIRATAIEPSFALLQQVKEQLEELRRSLANVSFS
jgi:hypothetical protein